MRVSRAVQIPCLHIADALGEFAAQNSLQNLGLLGTRFTMERDFFRDRLSKTTVSPSVFLANYSGVRFIE